MANVLQVIGLNTVTPQLEAGQTSNLDTYSMVSPLTIDPSGTAGYSGTNALTVTGNVSANALYQGTTNQAATTSIQLTASSVTSWIITGSGGQTIILPDATTLPVGAMFTFNNNQSSGAITVNVFGSGSAPATVQSGGYATVTLLTKSVAAGTWDVHYGTPSNVTWSTNTFNYPGAITGLTSASLGLGTATSLALNGATIGTNALAVTGSTLLTASNGTPAVTLTGGTQTGFALTTVAITGTAGQFSCDASTLTVGQFVTISGTLGGTGTITGYANPTTYLISATNGSTTFTLVNSVNNVAIVTTAGTPTGLTYTITAPLLNMTETWNNSNVLFTGLKANFTDTASNVFSELMDLQTSGVTKFNVGKDGSISANGTIKTGSGSLLISSNTQGLALRAFGTNITSPANNQIQLGNADAAAPVAQTLSVQSVVTGTTDVAGKDFTINGSRGTGTGQGGSIVFQTAPFSTTGTAQNALVNTATISPTGLTLSSTTTGLAPSIAASGSDTNVSLNIASKGTGSIDLTAGANGLSLTYGTVVSGLQRVAVGSGYTSAPTLAISAPNLPSGVQATATVPISVVVTPTVSNTGTSGTYNTGDVLTVSGGTFTSAATITITASGGLVTGVSAFTAGAYTVYPGASPVATTSIGTGVGATFTLVFGISNVFTITAAGSGYVEQPTVTLSSGGGSGASVIAQLGTASGTNTTAVIRTPNQSNSNEALQFRGPFGISTGIPILSLRDIASADSYLRIQNGVARVDIYPIGNANAALGLYSNGTGQILLGTGGAGQYTQLRINNIVSPVNYVTIQGSTTGNTPAVGVSGNDTNISLNLVSRGTGTINLQTGVTTATQFQVADTASAVNYWKATGSATGGTMTLAATGTDTDIAISIAPKNAGIVYIGGGSSATTSTVRLIPSGGNALYATANNTAVNYLQIAGVATGSAPQIIARGTDANVGISIGTLNDANIDFFASGDPNAGTGKRQFRISPTASAVNYFNVTGSATTAAPAISVAGSDPSISLNLVTKGTGTLQINGTAWQKTKTTLFSYTGSAQTYTMATGCVAVSILAVGGGGGGGFGGTYTPTTGGSGGAGAGAGGVSYILYRASDISASSPFTVTIGAGGSGGTSGTPTGGQGGITSVGSIAYGGGAGGGYQGTAGTLSGGGGGGYGTNVQASSGTNSAGGSTAFGLVGSIGAAAGGSSGSIYTASAGGGTSATGSAQAGGSGGLNSSGGGAGGGYNTTTATAGAASGSAVSNFTAAASSGGSAGGAGTGTDGTAGITPSIVRAGINYIGGGGGGGGAGNTAGGVGGAGGLGGAGGGGGASTTAGGNGGAGGNGFVYIVEYF
jgi:hypothetical protein